MMKPRSARSTPTFDSSSTLPAPPTPRSAEFESSDKKLVTNSKFPLQKIPPFRSKELGSRGEIEIRPAEVERRTSEPGYPSVLNSTLAVEKLVEERRLSDPLIIKKRSYSTVGTTPSGERIRDKSSNSARARKHFKNSPTGSTAPITIDLTENEPISKRLRIGSSAEVPPTPLSPFNSLYDAANQILNATTANTFIPSMQRSNSDESDRQSFPPPMGPPPPTRTRVGSIDRSGTILPSQEHIIYHQKQIEQIPRLPSQFQAPSPNPPPPSSQQANTFNSNAPYLHRPMIPMNAMNHPNSSHNSETQQGRSSGSSNYQHNYSGRPSSSGIGAEHRDGIAREGGGIGRGVDVRNRSQAERFRGVPPLQINTSIERSATANRFSCSPNSATATTLSSELPFSSHQGPVGPPPREMNHEMNRPVILRPVNAISDPKSRFLSLFATFYDSLGDASVLQRTLEDNIQRSNSLLGQVGGMDERFNLLERRIEELELELRHRR